MMGLTMKWNVEKASPIIDGIISVSIIIVLMWALPDDWFVNAKAVEYQNFIVAMMISYHIGLWSGRRFEQKKRGQR